MSQTTDINPPAVDPENQETTSHQQEPFSSDNDNDGDGHVHGGEEGDLDVENQQKKARIVVEKNDRGLGELHRWFQKRKLVIDPEWQRQFVWDSKRASKLIESILIDIPVPVVYFARSESGEYEVIDGLQRLTSVFQFFDGSYKLKGLEILTDLEGKYYHELDTPTKNKIEDASFRTFELAPSTPKDLMFVIFERLNTGGVALNEMEIRNCLYRGNLNNLLKELRYNKDFKDCINQKNLEKRMVDKSLVLRFLAFYEKTHKKAKSGLKAFLNDFFDHFREPSDDKLKEFSKKFNDAMRSSKLVFGDQGFRLRKMSEGKTSGEWASRVNAAIFQTIAVSFTEYDSSQIARAADRIFEEYLDLIYTDERWVNSVTRATGDFSNIRYAFEEWERRLAAVMEDVPKNDKSRVFSQQLKKELFEQNNTCSICGQEIKLINDAVLDHERHYWRGGQTVPSNARLAHRICNLTRSDFEEPATG